MLTGDGFASDIQVRFGGRALPLTFNSTTSATLTLPFWEDIGLPAGTQAVQVVNPDGGTSNIINFELSLVYKVRMKAWRVYPDHPVASGGSGSIGTDREVSEIHNILVDDGNSPRAIWIGQSIQLDLDPLIEDAFFPEPWGHGQVDVNSDPVDAINPNKFVDPGAINFYFVQHISDSGTWAYTGPLPLANPPPNHPHFVVFSDMATMSTSQAAVVASHEVGHAFGLPHVCSLGLDKEDPAGTTFGRLCHDPGIVGGILGGKPAETTDRDYLMYPRTNMIFMTATNITNQEAIVARRGAAKLHGK